MFFHKDIWFSTVAALHYILTEAGLIPCCTRKFFQHPHNRTFDCFDEYQHYNEVISPNHKMPWN